MKKKKVLSTVLPLIAGAVIGFLGGILFIAYAETLPEIDRQPYYILLEIGGIILVWYLNVIIHETGHLIGGLLSGYRFSSFRFGSIMWIKDNGKLRLRRMSLAGTGGQCLMKPPELKDGMMPVALYNLGGIAANLLSAVVFFTIHIITLSIPVIRTVYVFGFIIGIFTAGLNGIPMKLNGIANDGYNVLIFKREPDSVQSFWYQMKINEAISNGVRAKDMPSEWFTVPSDDKLKNHIHATIAVFACNRLMDEHRFTEADELMARLLCMDTGILDLYRHGMICDRIYCELIGAKRKDILDRLYTKEIKNFMKTMKNNPSVLRTEYAYAMIAENNPEKAYKISLEFDKYTAKYPYRGEAEAEYELMRVASSAAK